MKDTLEPQEVTQRRRKRQMTGRGGDSEQPFFCFKMGTQVEVSSDDEGFRGAWYVATILDVPSKKRKRNRKRHTSHEQFLVEYETLLADDDASTPLTEFVDVSFMRPLPPTDGDYDQRRSFELDEVVDAFYRDGWWTGVITRVVGDNGSTFLVSFQNPPDEIEFACSELRVHRDWVDRKWVRPAKQRKMGSMYSMGTPVEVCFDEENLCDVWFLAIFHREIGNNAFLVEYQSSGTNDEAGLSKVTVDILHIRPSPPHLEYKDFVLFEEVDAFCGLGWWRGVITRFLKERRYTILLKRTNEEKELNHQEIRPRMDWIDGKWVIVSQQVSIPLSGNQLHLGQNCNNANDSEMAAQLGLGAAKNNSFQRTQGSAKSRENKSEQSTPCSAKSPSYADASMKKKLKQVSKQQKVGVQGHQKGIRVELKGSIPKSRVRSSHASATSKDRNAGALNNQTVAAERKRTPRAGVKTPRGSGTDKEGYARGSNAEEIVEREGVAEKPDMSVIMGLERKKTRGSETENLPQLPGKSSVKLMSDKKKHLNHPERQNVRGITKPRSQVRRRPAKLLVEKPIGLVEGEDKNRAETASYEMVVKDCATQEAVQSTETGVFFQGMVAVRHNFQLYVPIEEALNLIKDGKKLLSGPQRHNNILSSSIMNLHLAKVDIQSNETIAQKSGRRLKKRASKRQIQKSISSSESQTQDSQDGCRGKTSEGFEADCTSKDVDAVIDEMPSHIFDDRPLLMWSEGTNSLSSENDSRISLGKTVEQCGVAIGRQDENAMQSPEIPSADNVSEKTRNLPFIKCSPVWETLESMEIFQMIPQQPHFRPLDKSKVNSREGLAIGSMVTFASVVERTSKLQFSDPRSMIDCSLETLSDLEIHGFDVDPVRGRLNELLSKKDRQEELEEQSKVFMMKLMEHSLETSKIDGEIQEMNREMKELQEKLALATSRMEMKGNEIAALQSKIKVIRKDIQNAQHDFEWLVAAPW